MLCTTLLHPMVLSSIGGTYHHDLVLDRKTANLLYGDTIHMYQKMMCKFLLAISTYKYVSVNTIAFLIRFDGLYGAIIIYKPGSLDTNGKAKSVDKEFVTTLIGKYIV